MSGLYLDGVNDLRRILVNYSVDSSTDCFDVKRDLWLRVTIFVHTALTLIRTVIVQALRGTGNLIGGLIHLDGDRFFMGLNDYFSLLIQAIALPILGVITFLLPQAGYKILHVFCKYCDTSREFDTDIVYKHADNDKEKLHVARKAVSNAVMGVFGAFTALVHTVTSTIEQAMSLNCGDALELFQESSRYIVLAPKNGFSSTCTPHAERDIFRAFRIDIESFNPSAIHNV